MYILLFLSSLFVGRAFCGWVCPGGGLNEICAVVTRKRVSGRSVGKAKYVISAVLLSAIVLLAARAGGFQSVDLFYGTGSSTITQELIMFFGALAMILPAAFAVGTRANCRYICWMAPIMIAGTAIRKRAGWAALHLEAHTELCEQCGTCNKSCPINLDVMEGVLKGELYHRECILCGSCVDACPHKAIAYAV